MSEVGSGFIADALHQEAATSAAPAEYAAMAAEFADSDGG
jgi:hypothetical protein